MNAIVSEEGQVMIPKKIRIDLGLEAGTVLEFEECEGKIIISKKTATDPVDLWLGFASLPEGQTVDEYLMAIRDR